MEKEPIAIVGYAHRLPGCGEETIWDILLGGKCVITEVAGDRWAKPSYLHPRKNEPGKAYTFAAGSIGNIADFDAAFFGISPREAAQMDPQQRLLLELAWRAFEHGGIRPSTWRKTDSAVFVGFSSSDYSFLIADDLASIEATTSTGNTASIAANRLSYIFDLRGPSLAVDTACSSTLVAFHQACNAIASGESSMALVGGVSLHMHPLGFINFSKTSMLSPTGTCLPFDADANGYVRSEGAGVFLLRRLRDAIRDGDKVFAVVEGTGSNCDGRTGSLTIPSADAQTALIESVYKASKVDPARLGYFEAHGTGTPVGDPIEASAIGRSIGRHRSATSPLLIGSVKGNLGHLETASGVAGLVKALLVLEHKVVPPTVGLRKPNPQIPFAQWNLLPVLSPTKLPAAENGFVGVNSFGFGGANAHVILSDRSSAPASLPKRTKQKKQPPLLVSANSGVALAKLCASLAEELQKNPERSIAELASALWWEREWLPERLAITGDRDRVLEALQHVAAGKDHQAAIPGRRISGAEKHAPVFVFSGNGSQWAEMGRQLLRENSLFLSHAQKADAAFQKISNFSVLKILTGEETHHSLAETEIAQPALFVLQVAFVQFLAERGIVPSAVIGHSVGEVAAAWAAGALSLDQSAEVVYHRSRLQGLTRGNGAMTAAAISSQEAGALLKKIPQNIRPSLAGENSSRGVTLAGCEGGLAHAEKLLIEQGALFKRLDLDYAFHSPAMDPIQAQLLESLRHILPSETKVPMISTVSGSEISGRDLDASYWWQNVRLPVFFHEGMQLLLAQDRRVFLEVGAHPVLRSYVVDAFQHSGIEGLHSATMTKTSAGAGQLERCVYEILQSGIYHPWEKIFSKTTRLSIALPEYPWQKERLWRASTEEAYALVDRYPEHPLLGYRLKETDFTWENHIDTLSHPLLAGHRVGESVVFPASGFLEAALAGAWIAGSGEAFEIEDMEIRAPLLLESTKSKTVRFHLEKASGAFTMHSKDRLSDSPWLLHATGKIFWGATTDDLAPSPAVVAALDSADVQIDGPAHYELAASLGLHYSGGFRLVDRVCFSSREISSTLLEPEKANTQDPLFLLHPCSVDAGLQTLLSMLASKDTRLANGIFHAYLPVRMGQVAVRKIQTPITSARCRVKKLHDRGILADFFFFDADGSPVADLLDVRFRSARILRRASEHAKILSTKLVPSPRFAPLDGSALPTDANDEVFPLPLDLLQGEGALPEVLQRELDELDPLLDSLCGIFLREEIGKISGEKDFSPDSWIRDGVAAEGMEPYVRTCLSILIEDGYAQFDSEENVFRWTSHTPAIPAKELFQGLLGDFPESGDVLRAIGRLALHLPSIFLGNTSPAELLPATWEISETSGALRIPGRYTSAANLLFEKVHLLASSSTRALSILWITDNCHLPSLPLPAWLRDDICNFTLGIVSSGPSHILQTRQLQFPEIAILSGFADDARPCNGQTFDVVVVDRSVPCTNERDFLRTVAQVTSEGGHLLLLEEPPSRLSDLLFGFSPRYVSEFGTPSEEFRGQAALERWRSALTDRNFSSTPCKNLHPTQASGPFLLSARRMTLPQEISEDPQTRHFLLFAEHTAENKFSREIKDLLEVCGHGVCSRDLSEMEEALAGDHGSSPQEVVVVVSPADEHQGSSATSFLARLPFLLSRIQHQSPPLPVTLVTINALAHLRLPEEAPDATPSPGNAALWGFFRVAQNEFHPLRLRAIDCITEEEPCLLAAQVAAELLEPDSENEIVISPHGRFCPRITELRFPCITPPPERKLVLGFDAPGSFKNLRWKSRKTRSPKAGELRVRVFAAGLNFRDVMYAMGMLPDEALENGFAGQTLGMEAAGIVMETGSADSPFYEGQEVVVFGPACFATEMITSECAAMPKPEGISFEAAATIPAAFFTAYYSLSRLANLQPGEKILIHGAAGGVGQAAIQIADFLGAEIFATAGTVEKREFLELLGAHHVLDSRSLDFAADIARITHGEGIDVVLNSLAGEAIERNLRVLRPFGRFLELGKRDFYENTKIGLRPFRNNIHYFGIDADQMMQEKPGQTAAIFKDLLGLFEQGALKPLPFTTFEPGDAADAFRYMQHSQQIGKVVIKIPGTTGFPETTRKPDTRLALEPNGTYLISGGLGGFGFACAKMLAARGASHLVLLSRRGEDASTKKSLDELRSLGLTATAPPCDVSDREGLARVLENIRSTCPPIRGVLHAAMVIDDALVANTTQNQIEKVLAPKLTGAQLLDEFTSGDPLEMFVLFSSATTCFGNPGQAAYVAANFGLESLAEKRRRASKPATCVAWGPIADTGYLAKNVEVRDALCSRMGGGALSSEDALTFLESAILEKNENLAWLDFDWTALVRFLPDAGSPKFSRLARLCSTVQGGQESRHDLREQLLSLSPEDLVLRLKALLKEQIGNILRIPSEKIDDTRSLFDLGMDSLMGVELAASLESATGLNLPLMALSEGPTVAKLALRLSKMLQGGDTAPDLSDEIRRIASQHGDTQTEEENIQELAKSLETTGR